MLKPRNISLSQRKLLVPLLAILGILVSFLGGINYQRFFGSQSQQQAQHPQIAIVTGIVDGDTIKLDLGKNVRLVAISAPEADEPFGQEAADFLSRTLKEQKVHLEYEENYEQDAYGRLLSYVFVNDTNINLELIRNGLAEVKIYQNVEPGNIKKNYLPPKSKPKTKS